MEIKLLLAKAISAIYYSSHSSQKDSDALTNLIDRTLEHLNLPDDPLETNREKSHLVKLRGMLVWMKGKGIEHAYDLNDLMARLRLNCGDNDRLYDLFCKSLLLVDDPDVAKDKVDQITSELMEFIAIEEFASLLKKANRLIHFERDKIQDIRKFRDEFATKIADLPLEGKRRAMGATRCIDLADIDSLSDVFHMAQTAINPDAILKFGFKAANRMTGDQDGARRGEWANTSALSGQNKSGDLLDSFIAFCIFNDPILFDKTKKPMHVYVTLEDKLELVFQKLYVILMQDEHGLPIKIQGIDPKEMAEYVHERLTRRGWHVRFLDYTQGGKPTDLVDDLRGFEEQGFEIFSLGLDYANLFDKSDIVAPVAGDEIQLCHRIIRKFTAPHDIYGYTAHQLSTQARELSRMYPEDYIKRLIDKGYYEGSKKLNTEFDYEKFICKTVKGGITWQEVQWGKHRKLGATAEHDKYYALKFLELPMIGFKYDLLLDVDLSYPKVGGRSASAGEGDWNSFE